MPYLSKSFCFASVLALSSCATNPLSVAKFDHSFPDRVLEINEAYYAELNGQILKNILRARDRLPRMYTSLSELKITPTATRKDSISASEFGLGNPGNGGNLNPWIKFGGSTALDNTSTLEMKISPQATNGEDKTPIYHKPISPQTFLTYYNDWQEETVDNVLVDQINLVANDVSIEYIDEKSKEKETTLTTTLTKKIIADSDGNFKVFLNGAKANYCLEDSDCPFTQSSKPTTSVTPSNVTINNVVTATTSNETKTPNGAVAASGSYRFTSTHKANILLDEEMQKDHPQREFNLRSGRMFACEVVENKVKVKKENWLLYECTIASRTINVPNSATLIYVMTHPKEECTLVKETPAKPKETPTKTCGMIPQKAGIYSITPNSIDNMIYRIGASLKKVGTSETWESNIKVKSGQKFFSATQPTSLDTINTYCQYNYAARTVYQRETYIAGPPEGSDNTGYEGCYKKDNTGTVLTLISELIKLNEVNAELKGSNFILSR